MGQVQGQVYSQNIKPHFKRSVHLGCNNYADVQMSNLQHARRDAQKLNDLCALKENEFDQITKLSDFSSSYEALYPHVIKSLDKLVLFSQGSAMKDPPMYSFNFISLSGHGVMLGDQTFVVVPFRNMETNAFEKQYINITAYAKKLAQVKNTFNIILFDGCRNNIQKHDLAAIEERSKQNLLRAAQEKSYTKDDAGFTIVIYSSKEGSLSVENTDGGVGTRKFLERIKENIQNGFQSWEFIDTYGEMELERFTSIPRNELTKISMFSHYPN